MEPATIPKPFLTDLALKMPTLYQESASGQHEEAWLRTRILSGLNKDEKIATTAGRDDDVLARKELEMDKLVLQMIDVSSCHRLPFRLTLYQYSVLIRSVHLHDV